MVNFQTINNDILIELPVVKETTDAGLIKPDSMIKEEKSKSDAFNLVVCVGTECKYIKVGDKVLVTGKHPKVEFEDKLYAIVNELHVLGKRIN